MKIRIADATDLSSRANGKDCIRSKDMNPKLNRVLSWVNRMRAKHFGKGPLETLPKGIEGEGAACPIHNSFWKPYCGGTTGLVRTYKEDFIIRHPQYIQDFVLDFDYGKYPELVRTGELPTGK